MHRAQLVLRPVESSTSTHESTAGTLRRSTRCGLVPARSFAMSLLAILTRTALGLAPAAALGTASPGSPATPAPLAPSGARGPAHIVPSVPLLAAPGIPAT